MRLQAKFLLEEILTYFKIKIIINRIDWFFIDYFIYNHLIFKQNLYSSS